MAYRRRNPDAQFATLAVGLAAAAGVAIVGEKEGWWAQLGNLLKPGGSTTGTPSPTGNSSAAGGASSSSAGGAVSCGMPSNCPSGMYYDCNGNLYTGDQNKAAGYGYVLCGDVSPGVQSQAAALDAQYNVPALTDLAFYNTHGRFPASQQEAQLFALAGNQGYLTPSGQALGTGDSRVIIQAKQQGVTPQTTVAAAGLNTQDGTTYPGQTIAEFIATNGWYPGQEPANIIANFQNCHQISCSGSPAWT